MSADASRDAEKYLLEQLLAESKTNGSKLDEVLSGHRKLTNHFLKIAERQIRDRQLLREQQRRLERLEVQVFHQEPPLQRPTTPLMAWMPSPPMRPPAPSEPDSAIHDLEALKADVAGLKPHVEQQRRRDSWWYRKKRDWLLGIVAAVLLAGASSGITWFVTHVHLG